MDVKAKLAAQRERLEVLRQRSERLGRDLPEGSIREEFMRGVEETRREVEQAIADTERTIFKLEVENDLEGFPLAFEPWWRRMWSRLRAPIGWARTATDSLTHTNGRNEQCKGCLWCCSWTLGSGESSLTRCLSLFRDLRALKRSLGSYVKRRARVRIMRSANKRIR